MTPLHLQILLHYYVSPEPFPNFSNTAAEYAKDLLDSGLLDPGPVVSPLGKAHVKQLLSLPGPRAAFIGFDGREIDP